MPVNLSSKMKLMNIWKTWFNETEEITNLNICVIKFLKKSLDK